jgi:hypothetical protein
LSKFGTILVQNIKKSKEENEYPSLAEVWKKKKKKKKKKKQTCGDG